MNKLIELNDEKFFCISEEKGEKGKNGFFIDEELIVLDNNIRKFKLKNVTQEKIDYIQDCFNNKKKIVYEGISYEVMTMIFEKYKNNDLYEVNLLLVD